MKKSYLSAILIILSLTACYSPTANLYNSEKTKGVDFKNYKTYAFLPSRDTSAYTKLADRKVVESALAAAVIQQLTARGMTRDQANPDCLFTYHLVLTKTYEVGQTPPPVYAPNSNVGPLPGQYDMYYYVPASTANYDPDLYQSAPKVTTFRDGTLVIDMIDRKSKKIVWTTSAQGSVKEKDRQGARPTINEIIPIMFKKFPTN
jgi:hypothetical protein